MKEKLWWLYLEKKIPLPPSITQLKLLATRQAAFFVQEVGLRSSILEGVSEIVINSLRKGEMFQSTFDHLIQDTLVYVNSLQSFSFSHIYRQGNFVADALAKKARFGSSLTVWMESIPPDICTFVLADRPFLD